MFPSGSAKIENSLNILSLKDYQPSVTCCGVCNYAIFHISNCRQQVPWIYTVASECCHANA